MVCIIHFIIGCSSYLHNEKIHIIKVSGDFKSTIVRKTQHFSTPILNLGTKKKIK